MSAATRWAAAACLLAGSLAACSTDDCQNEKCDAPSLPSHAIHLVVDGKPASSDVSLELARPSRFSLTIDRASGVTVRDVYLLVTGEQWTNGPDGPTGRVKIVSHHPGALVAGTEVTGTWLPADLWSGKTFISVVYDLGHARVGETAAQIHLTT